MSFTTTLRKLRACGLSVRSYNQLVNRLSGSQCDDSTSLSIGLILEYNGIQDALWATKTCKLTDDENVELRLLACDYAEYVLPLFESGHPTDKRLREIIEASRAGKIYDGAEAFYFYFVNNKNNNPQDGSVIRAALYATISRFNVFEAAEEAYGAVSWAGGDTAILRQWQADKLREMMEAK